MTFGPAPKAPPHTGERLLYTYFRSSASYRVRIALNLKGLPYRSVPVHLLRDGGQQHASDFAILNPQELVPVMIEEGRLLKQSLAIIEYLEERYPEPPLLPETAEDRAHVRAVALAIACELHPINNLRVLQYLSGELQVTDTQRLAWIQHWLRLGLQELEEELRDHTGGGRFVWGERPTLADCCLVPQLFNARRFGIRVEDYPTLATIDAVCAELPAFKAAHPAQQPDAE